MEQSVARQHQERSDRRTCPSVAEDLPDLPDRDSGSDVATLLVARERRSQSSLGCSMLVCV